MSDLLLTIRDGNRGRTGRVAPCVAEGVVAALSAEPETIDELAIALGRFFRPDEPGWPLNELQELTPELAPEFASAEPIADLAIDLPGRVCLVGGELPVVSRTGTARYHQGKAATETAVPYRLSDEWLLSSSSEHSAHVIRQRRAARAAQPRLDWRQVLYGELPRVLVTEMTDCLRRGEAQDPARQVHIRWLTTPRPDLGRRAPRELLLAQLDDLTRDLEAREWQWACLGECPPELPRESAAYRYAGCGPHEFVLYYDLVRYLLSHLLQRGARLLERTDDAIEQSRQQCEEWLDSAQTVDLHGLTPRQVIEQERARRPWALSPEEAIIDHDCPLCRMMAEEMSGPVFWHIDEVHFDHDFAFSRHLDRASWESEQREWAEMMKAMDADEDVPADVDDLLGFQVWKSSMCDVQKIVASPPDQPRVSMLMFGLAGHLAELGSDVRNLKTDSPAYRRLMSDFDDLRAALLERADWLVDSLIVRAIDATRSLSLTIEPLREKCGDLIRKFETLRQLCEQGEPALDLKKRRIKTKAQSS